MFQIFKHFTYFQENALLVGSEALSRCVVLQLWIEGRLVRP